MNENPPTPVTWTDAVRAAVEHRRKIEALAATVEQEARHAEDAYPDDQYLGAQTLAVDAHALVAALGEAQSLPGWLDLDVDGEFGQITVNKMLSPDQHIAVHITAEGVIIDAYFGDNEDTVAMTWDEWFADLTGDEVQA